MIVEIVLAFMSLVLLFALNLVWRVHSMKNYWLKRGIRVPTYPPLFPFGNSPILIRYQ